MTERFRDSAWDNQLDNMLDDLQTSVQEGVPYQNGVTNGYSSHSYQEKQEGNRREVVERSSRVGGGQGQPYTYREERQYTSTTTTSNGLPGAGAGTGANTITNMGTKRAVPGNIEQHLIDEKKTTDIDSIRGRSDSLVSDLSSIAKVRSVSKVSSSTERHYTSEVHTNSTSSNTQQSIKKNINDLDHLLNNLSSHNGGPSLPTSKHGSREPSPTRRGHVSRIEERRERLISNASQYRTPSMTRTPSQSRPHSPHSSIAPPTFPSSQPRTPEPTNQHDFNTQTQYTSTMRSNISNQSNPSSNFRPVHTVPDPLTGRYPDGRITPNHGYTRNFSTSQTGSPMVSRRIPTADSSIPKKPEELLSSLGQEVDQREMARISQEETITRSKIEMAQHNNNNNIEPEEPKGPTINKPGPPIYYPTRDLYTKKEEEVEVRGEGSKGEYFSAAYAREKGSSSKHETGEKGGAAVVPICLPLCCAAPCSIM